MAIHSLRPRSEARARSLIAAIEQSRARQRESEKGSEREGVREREMQSIDRTGKQTDDGGVKRAAIDGSMCSVLPLWMRLYGGNCIWSVDRMAAQLLLLLLFTACCPYIYAIHCLMV